MSSILDILTFSHAAGSNNPKVITQENLYLANNLVFNVVQTDPDDTDALQEEQQMWVTKWKRALVHGYQSRISCDANNAIGPFTQLPVKG